MGQELGQNYLQKEPGQQATIKDEVDGSRMMIVATDAPVDVRNLKRLTARAWLGMARAGNSAPNGSGDYAIAFSTSSQLRINASNKSPLLCSLSLGASAGRDRCRRE